MAVGLADNLSVQFIHRVALTSSIAVSPLTLYTLMRGVEDHRSSFWKLHQTNVLQNSRRSVYARLGLQKTYTAKLEILDRNVLQT